MIDFYGKFRVGNLVPCMDPMAMVFLFWKADPFPVIIPSTGLDRCE